MKPAPRRWNLAGQMPLVSLILLCAATALLTNRFLSPFNLTNILVQSSIMAVIAMGMTFVIIGGGFDLSVGSTAALSGCIASMVMLEAGIGAGIAAGTIAGAAVGLANGLVIAFLNVNPFITTLGTMVLVRGVVFLITGGAPVSGESGLPGAFIAFGSERFLGIHYLVWIPAVLLAVLERRGGLSFDALDVFVNVTGGVRLAEPSTDLAVLAALVSSVRDRPVPADAVFLGEVGLGGEIRPVAALERRLAEAARQGFRRVFCSARARGAPEGLELVGMEGIGDLARRLAA